MRQRKLKNLDEKLALYSGGIQINPMAMKGRWQALFEKEQPIYMELGCGKGQFILKLAQAYPERNFIAVEGNRSVMLRALEKASRVLNLDYDPEEVARPGRHPHTPLPQAVAEHGMFAVDEEKAKAAAQEYEESKWSTAEDDCVYAVLPNLIFANMYLRSVTDCFEKNELSGIYLNFSDPWPKDRNAKRRLTHTRYLKGYQAVTTPDACLEFKTDNEGLFRFSVEEFDANELEKLEYTEDLHGEGSAYESANYMTEYEQKFSSKGNPIYYCKVKL